MTIAYVVLFIAFLDNFAMLPTVGPYAEQLGAGLTGVGVAVGAYSLTNLVFNVVGGVLLDRVGRRRLVVISLLLVSLAMLAYPLATTLEGLVAVRLLHGMGGGILVPAVFTVLADHAPLEGRGRAMGRAGAVIGTAAVIAPGLAGGVRQAAGFTIVFLVVAGVAALGALIAHRGLRETAPPSGRARTTIDGPGTDGATAAGVGALLAQPTLRNACLSALLFTGAVGTLAAFLPGHAEGLGLPDAASGGLFTVFAVVAVVLMLSRAAGLVESIGEGLPIGLGFLAYAVALGLLSAAPGVALTTLAAGIFGLGYGLVFPAMAGAVSGAAAPEERGRAYGIFMAFFSLGFVVVPPLGGLVADRWAGLSPFAVATAVSLLGAALGLAHRGRTRPPATAAPVNMR